MLGLGLVLPARRAPPRPTGHRPAARDARRPARRRARRPPRTARRRAPRAPAAAAVSVPQIGLVTVAPAPGASRCARSPRRLRADPRVRRASQPERRVALRFEPNDPALTHARDRARHAARARPSSGGPRASGLPGAWDVTTRRGRDRRRHRHRASTPRTPSSPGSIADTIDLRRRPGTARPTIDEVGHGTHVASLACAAGNNGIGIAGAGLRLRAAGRSSPTSATRASRRRSSGPTDHGADAINMTFGDRPGAHAAAGAVARRHRLRLSPTASCWSPPRPTTPSRSRATRPTCCSRRAPARTCTRGTGLSVTAADFDRPPRAVRRARHADLARRLRHATTPRGSGPPGIFGAFPSAADRSSRRGTLGAAARPVPLPHDVPAATPATPTSRARRWPRRWSRPSPRSMRHLNPDLPAADVVRAAQADRAAARPGAAGRRTSAGGSSTPARRSPPPATIDRRPPTSKLRAHGRGARTARPHAALARAATAAPPGVVAVRHRRYELWRSLDGAPGAPRSLCTTERAMHACSAERGHRYRFFTSPSTTRATARRRRDGRRPRAPPCARSARRRAGARLRAGRSRRRPPPRRRPARASATSSASEASIPSATVGCRAARRSRRAGRSSSAPL